MCKYKLNEIPNIIWTQILYLFIVVWALIGGVVGRHNDPAWEPIKDVRLKYDLFYGAGLSVLCLAVIVGLLLKKEWGRQLAISLHFLFIFTILVMRFGVFLYTKYAFGKGVVVIDLTAIILFVISLFFLVVLTRKNVKDFYMPKTIKG